MEAKQELDCWHAFDGCARFVLRRDAEIIRYCILASQLLRGETGFALRAGKLCLRETPLSIAQLEERIGAGRIGLIHRTGDRLLLAGFSACSVEGEPAVALMLRLVEADERPDFACLGEAFNLTPAEEGIALQLLGGSSASEIAASEQLSINTVRSHIAHIYTKLAVRSREEMWTKCASFMVNRSDINSSVINLYDARRNSPAYEVINRTVI